jgi:hypothetical protein
MLVAIYLRGEDLDPTEITNLLGINPSDSQKRGDVMNGTKSTLAKIGVWSRVANNKSDNIIDHLAEIQSVFRDCQISLPDLKNVSEAYLDIYVALDPKEEFVEQIVEIPNDSLKFFGRLGLKCVVTVG